MPAIFHRTELRGWYRTSPNTPMGTACLEENDNTPRQWTFDGRCSSCSVNQPHTEALHRHNIEFEPVTPL